MRLLVVVHRKRHGVYRGVERKSAGKRRGDDKTFLVRFHLDTVECGRNVNIGGEVEGRDLQVSGVAIASLWPLKEMLRVEGLDSTQG